MTQPTVSYVNAHKPITGDHIDFKYRENILCSAVCSMWWYFKIIRAHTPLHQERTMPKCCCGIKLPHCGTMQSRSSESEYCKWIQIFDCSHLINARVQMLTGNALQLCPSSGMSGAGKVYF